jgi:AcrR family transcriptional regulator
MPPPNPSRAPRRRGYHHGDLRAVLLAAGEAELAEHGVEGFSLRGVAKRAGVSHAAPAHHFRDANGLLTALAAEGFRRFVDKQKLRQQAADRDALSQLVAAGMGYIDFAMAHPALFRLMFSSDRPDHEAEELHLAARAAYRQLVEDVARLHGPAAGSSDPSPAEVMRTWAVAHGLADLMNSRRLKPLLGLRKSERDAALAEMLRRSLG